MTLSTGTTVRFIGKREVDAKLLAAAPRILEENRLMVMQMLEAVRAEIQPTPGYRSSLRVEVTSSGVKTIGKLWGAARAYWRAFGTRGRFRGRSNRRRAYAAAIGAFGGGGERADLLPVKAMNRVRAFLRFYYGKAQWWRL